LQKRHIQPERYVQCGLKYLYIIKKPLTKYFSRCILYIFIYEEMDMKKSGILSICFLTAVLSVNTVYGQGFTGPGSGANAGQVQTVTVIQAKGLPDNSLVILTSNIVQSIRREKYTFRDSTGDITIEVDRDLWTLLDLSVGTNDRVEIRGEIDYENRVAEVDVKYIKKL
jgi:uncharacterized protein (TIGR00156 family)